MPELLTIILLTISNTQVNGYWMHMLIPIATYAIGYVMRRKEMLEILKELNCYKNAHIGVVSEDTLEGMDMIIAKMAALLDDVIEDMAEDYERENDQVR